MSRVSTTTSEDWNNDWRKVPERSGAREKIWVFDKPRDPIEWVQMLFACGISAAFFIYMLPVFVIVVIAHLIGLGPDAVSPGARSYKYADKDG